MIRCVIKGQHSISESMFFMQFLKGHTLVLQLFPSDHDPEIVFILTNSEDPDISSRSTLPVNEAFLRLFCRKKA